MFLGNGDTVNPVRALFRGFFVVHHTLPTIYFSLFLVFKHVHHAGQAAFSFGFGNDGRTVFTAEQFDVVLRHFVYKATRGHELPLAHFFALHAVG